MKRCQCGSKQFTIEIAVSLDADLERKGKLWAVTPEQLPISGVVSKRCERRYSLDDFTDVEIAMIW